jgi:hypothetical protein
MIAADRSAATEHGAVLLELGAAAEQAAQARAARDALVVAAVRAGASLRAVARACGMTHPGVTKIVRRAS